MAPPLVLFTETCLDSQRSFDAQKLDSFDLHQMYHQSLMEQSEKMNDP